VIAERRASPQEDLISALVLAESEGERLSRDEMLSFCNLLLFTGTVTTTHLIGSMIRALLDHPDQLACLTSDPSLISTAVEEVLRYHSPAQAIIRVAIQDVELGGRRIGAGQRVLAWIGSANRDESVFSDPERFDITRDPNPHIAFGKGIHFCLGASLSRLETRTAVPILLERLPGLKHASRVPLEPVPGFFLFGVRSLPLEFVPQGLAGSVLATV
jgi:cytochrome P450